MPSLLRFTSAPVIVFFCSFEAGTLRFFSLEPLILVPFAIAKAPPPTARNRARYATTVACPDLLNQLRIPSPLGSRRLTARRLFPFRDLAERLDLLEPQPAVRALSRGWSEETVVGRVLARVERDPELAPATALDVEEAAGRD